MCYGVNIYNESMATYFWSHFLKISGRKIERKNIQNYIKTKNSLILLY